MKKSYFGVEGHYLQYVDPTFPCKSVTTMWATVSQYILNTCLTHHRRAPGQSPVLWALLLLNHNNSLEPASKYSSQCPFTWGLQEPPDHCCFLSVLSPPQFLSVFSCTCTNYFFLIYISQCSAQHHERKYFNIRGMLIIVGFS